MSDLTIRIAKESPNAIVSVNNGNGRVENKSVKLEGIIGALQSNIKLSSGLLPSNTKFYGGTPADYWIGVESGERKRYIFDQRGGKFNLACPRVLFVFYVKNYRVHDSYCFVIKETIKTDKDSLFRFPFGNTYPNGLICWGGVSNLKVASPMNITEIIAAFWNSQFNGDLIDRTTIRDVAFGQSDSRSYMENIARIIEKDEEFDHKRLYDSEGILKSFLRG